jgi:hypothetical protein
MEVLPDDPGNRDRGHETHHNDFFAGHAGEGVAGQDLTAKNTENAERYRATLDVILSFFALFAFFAVH